MCGHDVGCTNIEAELNDAGMLDAVAAMKEKDGQVWIESCHSTENTDFRARWLFERRILRTSIVGKQSSVTWHARCSRDHEGEVRPGKD